jgi:nucleotide-binding universal stress UspA family protein
MFERILVPLDGSERATQALSVAARIARATGGSILLTQVIVPIVYDGVGLAPSPIVTPEVIEMDQQDAESYLKEVAASPVLAGIATSCEVLFGFPAQQILRYAREQAVDLIVINSHGRTGLTRWVLGSVAQQVTHESATPVLVLREGGFVLPGAHPEMLSRPVCALVALDGSDLAEAVLEPAANLVSALSTPTAGALHLMRVVKSVSTSSASGAAAQMNEEAVEEVKAYLAAIKARLQEQFPEHDLAISWLVTLNEDVAGDLISAAQTQSEGEAGRKEADLIAMSTHGRGGFARLVMGSITERVLETSRLPMLIVRPASLEQKGKMRS